MDKKIRIVASVCDNNVIGIDNRFSAYQDRQLNVFRNITLKTPVIIGRKTQDYLQYPFDQRVCITISKFKNRVADGFIHANGIEDSLNIANKFDSQYISIIGGESIFHQFIPLADEICIIEMYTTVDGNKFFPELNWFDWKLKSRVEYTPGFGFPFSLVTFSNINKNKNAFKKD